MTDEYGEIAEINLHCAPAYAPAGVSLMKRSVGTERDEGSEELQRPAFQ